MITEEAFLLNESAMNHLANLLEDPVMVMAIRHVRGQAPRNDAYSHHVEQWQQTRYDGICTGWDACIYALESLPEVMERAMIARANAANSTRAEYEQHEDLPDHTDF